MDPTLPDFPALLLEASRSAPGVEVLEDDAGDRVRIDREDGWLHAVLERPAGTHGGAELWRTEALAERPGGLPDGVPFLAGVPGVVVLSGERTFALWPWWGESPAAPTASAFLAEEPLGWTPEGTGGGLGASLTLDPAGTTDGALALGFERLTEDGVHDGWEVDSEQFSGPPFPSRQLRLRREGRVRFVTFSGVGAGGEVVLMELPTST